MKQYSPGSVIAAEGLIYNYTYKGEMALIKPNPDGYEVISVFKVPGEKRDHIAHPVIHNGRLYLRYTNSIWVYNIRK
jgi:outer membrane protein assembly factor BamB